MPINLRTEKKNELGEIASLMKRIQSLRAQRHEIADLKRQTRLLLTLKVNELIKPITRKAKIGFHIAIGPYTTEVSTLVQIMRKTHPHDLIFNWRIIIVKFGTWKLTKPNAMKVELHIIESTLRKMVLLSKKQTDFLIRFANLITTVGMDSDII